jgi:hypothetical protein
MAGRGFVNDFNDLSTYIPYENQSYGPEYNGKACSTRQTYIRRHHLNGSYSGLGDAEKKDFFDKGITTPKQFFVSVR